MATAVVEPAGAWTGELLTAARRLAVISLAGAISGVVVGGVGGRLAMLLIARLNPAATGRISDDGFRMGQFTASGTLSLLGAGLFLGLFAALVYALLRGLMTGPRWFRLLSISLGPAVVVGSMLVHTDGIDFTVLQPAALSIALFVALPGLAVLVLSLLAERWLSEDAWPARAPTWALLPILLLNGPLLMLVGGLAIGWLVVRQARGTEVFAAPLAHPALPWVLRGGLSVIFVAAGAYLVRDIIVLV